METPEVTGKPPVRMHEFRPYADVKSHRITVVVVVLVAMLVFAGTAAVFGWQRVRAEHAAAVEMQRAQEAAAHARAAAERARAQSKSAESAAMSALPGASQESEGAYTGPPILPAPIGVPPADAAGGAPGTMPGGMPGMPGIGGGGMGHASEGYGGGMGMGYGMGAPGMEMPGMGMSGMDMMSGTPGDVRQQFQSQLAPLLTRLKESRNDEQKAAAKRQLSAALEGYFDQDMQRRLKELAQIESRVQRLRKLCDQRQKARDQILQLQLKVLENEAAGLGFFSGNPQPESPPGFMPGMEGMPGGGMGEGGSLYGSPVDSGMGGGYGMAGGMMAGMPGSMMAGGMEMIPAAAPPEFLKRIKVEFADTPLQDICSFLRDQSGANIYLDPKALKDKGVDSQTKITLQLGEISIAGALELLADSLSDLLGVRYEDGVAMIVPRNYSRRPDNDFSPASQRTAVLLSKTGDYSLEGVKLEDALDFFRDSVGVSVFLNRRSLQQSKIDDQSPISINLKGVPHRTALKLMLSHISRELWFALVDGVVVIAGGPPRALQPAGSSAVQPYVSGSAAGDPVQVTSNPAAADLRPGEGEDLSVLETTLAAAQSRFEIVESEHKVGRITSRELQEAQAALDIAKAKLSAARRAADARAKLLQLELERAQLELQAAKEELNEVMELNRKAANVVPAAEVRQREIAVKQAELTVQRIQTLMDLEKRPEPAKPRHGSS